MPHAVDQNELDNERDNKLISDLISGVQHDESSLDFLSRELEPGEKANDAEDFEDIADDDLAEDEDPSSRLIVEKDGYSATGDSFVDGKPALDSDRADDDAAFDDLFGDRPSSPPEEQKDGLIESDSISQAKQYGQPVLPFTDPGVLPEANVDADGPSISKDLSENLSEMDYEFGEDNDPELREQQELFAQAQKERDERLRRGDGLLEFLPAPQTNAELFETIWPRFEPNVAPRFHELLGVKRAFYIEKKPLKAPKAIPPTKLKLDLMQDQERTFRLPGSDVLNKQQKLQKAKQDQVVLVNEGEIGDESDTGEVKLDILDDAILVGNIGLQDLTLLCEDWNTQATDITDSVDGGFEQDDADGEGGTRSPKVSLFI